MEPPVPKVPPPPPSMRQPAAKQYALRFISGKYQGGEFPLSPTKEIVVGRSSELDMVLVEDMVSRRHARITVLGRRRSSSRTSARRTARSSTARRSSEPTLSEGDRVLIGTSILKVVVAGGGAPPR
jgi:hypothetical protein